MNSPLYIKQTASTNGLLRQMIRENNLPEGFVLYTDFQSAGKGQMGNSWESDEGKNLLFSMVLYPKNIAPWEQFLISQLVSLAIKKTLDEYTDGITIKWPNDIYWHDKKIAGILIENSLQGKNISYTILGIGLNVNQLVFESDSPNPISLGQITKKLHDVNSIMEGITQNILHLYNYLDKQKIREMYWETMYRKNGIYTFCVDNQEFKAKLFSVHADGKLELETVDGQYQGYYFKEVSFII